MASITTWNRLELRCRQDEPDGGVRAEVHDPLWLLGRQHQLAAFLGEDGGTPVAAEVQTTSRPLATAGTGRVAQESAGPSTPWRPEQVPLEALLGARPVSARSAGALRRAALAGRQLQQELQRAGLSHHHVAFLERYPLPAPANPTPRDAAWHRLLQGRVLDGTALLADLDGGVFQDPVGLEPTDQPALQQALARWRAAVAPFAAPPLGDGWQPERLEYAASVGAPGGAKRGGTTLVADPWGDAALDWSAFDVQPSAAVDAAAQARSQKIERQPVPVRYRGAPAPRFWEVEDEGLNLHELQVRDHDLGRMVFLEYALLFGNDWFVVPVTLPHDALHRVDRLAVTDTFGGVTEIDALSSPTFSLFRPTVRGQSGPDPELLLVGGARHDGGEATEEIAFVHDELSNLAWGIERRVSDATGHPRDRPVAPSRPPEPPPTNGEVRYSLAHVPPPAWVPLVPQAHPDGLFLVRGTLLHGTDPASARGDLLRELVGERLHHHEVPREGVVVSERWRYARAADGTPHLWLATEWRVGRGGAASGLSYDGLS